MNRPRLGMIGECWRVRKGIVSNVSDPPRDTTIPTVMGEGNASRKRASLPGQRGIILLIAPDVGNMSWAGNEHSKVASVGATNLAPRRSLRI